MAGEPFDALSLNIAIDDDLIAAALASVEKPAKATATATDSDEEDIDIEIDLDDEGFDLDDLSDEDDDSDDEDEDEDEDEDDEVSRLRQALSEVRAQRGEDAAEREKLQLSNRKLRKEVVRLRALGQRSRERLDSLEAHRKRSEAARMSTAEQIKHLHEANLKSQQQLRHLQERRRQEKEEQRKFGHSKAVLAMLPAIDHLQLATLHAGANPEAVLRGVQMVLSQFHGSLSSIGVSRVPAEPGVHFKPEVHEAMLTTPTDEVEPGQIFREIASGYVINGRLLRAARVAVAAALPRPPVEEEVPVVEEEEEEEEEMFRVPPELSMEPLSAEGAQEE
ncbi:MAG: molecular chaperone GrpE [Myxococcota bacterium]